MIPKYLLDWSLCSVCIIMSSFGTGTISVYFGPTLGLLYTEFSQALGRYSHNLLARNVLSPALQTTLLSHLGVSPWTAPVDSTTTCTSWPLQVYPRTLAILAQVMFLLCDVYTYIGIAYF